MDIDRFILHPKDRFGRMRERKLGSLAQLNSLTDEAAKTAFAPLAGQGTRRHSRVFFFAEKDNNELLWASYADYHRGICLGFDTNAAFFAGIHPARYLDAPKIEITSPSAPITVWIRGQRIVTWNYDGTATVMEAANGKEVLTLGTHNLRGPSAQRSGISAAFSPDGRWIVTGSTDNTAKVWDAVSGKELLTLKGHSDPVSCVTFSPDGKRILTGSIDQTAKLWDTASGRELLTLTEHRGEVSYAAFSPDGRWVFTGRLGKAEKAWEAAPPEQVAQWQAEDAPN